MCYNKANQKIISLFVFVTEDDVLLFVYVTCGHFFFQFLMY